MKLIFDTGNVHSVSVTVHAAALQPRIRKQALCEVHAHYYGLGSFGILGKFSWYCYRANMGNTSGYPFWILISSPSHVSNCEGNCARLVQNSNVL